MRSHNLHVCELIYGYWSGQPDMLNAFQDCLIAVKRQLD